MPINLINRQHFKITIFHFKHNYLFVFQRHGSFVWDELPPGQVDKMLHEFGYISDKLQQTDPYGDVATSGKGSRRSSSSSSKTHGSPSHKPVDCSKITSPGGTVHLPPVAAV